VSCAQGVPNGGTPLGDDCTIARYGSIWSRISPDLAFIQSRAALHARKYCSSVRPAAALTEVVTPPGETPDDAPALADAEAEVDEDDEDEDEPGVASRDDEQPANIVSAPAANTPDTATSHQRTATMCARLLGVMGVMGTRECCRA
jgi:hypothetical protein